MSIKKTILIKIKDEEVSLDVDFTILEKVERVYNCTAEIAAAIHLSDMMKIKRHQIANVISLWAQGKTKFNASDINEQVQTSSQKNLYKYAGMIQAAVLFSIRNDDGNPMITSDQFDKLINGEDITEGEVAGEDPEKKEKAKAKKRKATSQRRAT